MSQAHVIAKTWQQNLLYSVLVELTYRCNLDCFYCYNDVNQKGRPLSAEQYEAFLRDLADMQAMDVSFSGGEPLAHPDFFRLGATARELGFVVRIKSNGHALRGPLARRVREEVDPFIVEVTLHGASGEVHDRQTRVPGSFDQLLANLEGMKRIGLRVKLNATLTSWNEHQIVEMYDLAERLGLALNLSPTVTQRDDGDREPLSIAPSDEAVRTLYAERQRRFPDPKKRPAPGPGPAAPSIEKNCGAGSSGIAVDPYGNVYPCVQWRRPVGNLHERSIKEIWSGSGDLDEIRDLTVRAKQVKDGTGLGGLSFCPGLSEVNTGDPLGLDPEAVRHAEILDEVLEQGSSDRLPILR